MLTALALAAACPPLPGVDAVLARSTLTYLLFGEYHGTEEMPGVVADVLCHAKATGRPVALGIELPADAQPALDAFARSGDRAALLAHPAWAEEGGRTTAAIFELLESARRLGVRAVAFDRLPSRDTSAEREQAMADMLSRAGANDTLVVALTGVGHADKEGFTSRTPPILAAAGRLPQARTVSLTFARPGGAFWGCHSADGSPNRGCTSYPMPVREDVRPRGLVVDPAYRGGFDGFYSAGAQYTASRPAKPFPY
jgi:hypothetical protein